MPDQGSLIPQPNNKQELQLDGLAALSGADEVRKRLLALVSMGHPSIESEVYLIKCRIKDLNRLVEKVIIRRSAGNPSYTARHVTDIVGLRIITLHKDELAIVLAHLLEVIQCCHNDIFYLFKGPELKDTIFEAIVYRTFDESDPTHELILNAFRDAGFTVAVVPHGASPADVEADVKVIRKPTQYSSIHLLLWCSRGTAGSDPVPVEVQIRTALEDIWGEIQHQLEYKRQCSDPSVLIQNKQLLALASESLVTLKKQLDLCANTASQIRRYILGAFLPDVKTPLASVDTHVLTTLGLSPALQNVVDDVVKRLHGIHTFLSRPDEAVANLDHGNILGALTFAVDSLERVITQYNADPLIDASKHRTVVYYLTMECALNLQWKARLLNAKARMTGVSRADSAQYVQDADSCINRAIELYFLLENDKDNQRDPILAVRIGEALAHDGHSLQELAYYTKAAENIDKLPKTHYMRVAIPRRLGLALWAQGNKIAQDALRYKNPGLLLDQRLDFYFKAYDVTARALNEEIDDVSCKASGTSYGRERTLVINNLLDYGVEYIRAGGDVEKIARLGFTKEFVERELPTIEDVDNPCTVDTVRIVAAYMGNREKEVAAAQKALALLEARDWSPFCSAEVIEEMRSGAANSLNDGI